MMVQRKFSTPYLPEKRQENKGIGMVLVNESG